MIRVLLANGYSMEHTYELWKSGKGVSQHVWGKVELDRGDKIKMSILPHQKFKFLDKIGDYLGINHLDQQIRILFMLNKFDVLYAPYPADNTKLILFLKWLGLFRKPTVVTIHLPFLGTNSKNALIRKITKSLMLSHDGIVFLSNSLKDHSVAKLGIKSHYIGKKIFTAPWGPDYEYYKKLSKEEDISDPYLIAAGLSSRDYDTLLKAFKKINYKLKLFCSGNAIPSIKDVPPNVEIKTEFITYDKLVDAYLKSVAVLIPLKYDLKMQGCQGMTGLQDAIGFGKPVIITRSPTLNLLVQEEGIGLEVEMGDVDGWVNAVNLLMEDENLRSSMKSKISEIFETRFNSEIFAEKLSFVISKVFNNSN